MLLPWCHSIIQLHLPLAEPSHTHLAAVMPAGASAKQIFAKRPIYKVFWGVNNFVPFKTPCHRCFLLPSRQDFRQRTGELFAGLFFLPLIVVAVTASTNLSVVRQPDATRAALGSELVV